MMEYLGPYNGKIAREHELQHYVLVPISVSLMKIIELITQFY